MRREERTERTERSQEARGMMRLVKKNYVYNPTMVAVVEELTDEMLRAAVENAMPDGTIRVTRTHTF